MISRIIMSTKKFCEKSIYWVLSYRRSPRKKLHKLYRYGFVDDHTDETWEWTLAQSDIIYKKGFDYWLKKTEGPYGYEYWHKNKDQFTSQE
jgi:hypothetical protein